MTPADLTTLEARLTAERLTSYYRAAGSDRRGAIRLYEWNADVSAAFWSVLAQLEVLMRNAMHDQLASWSTNRYGRPDWYSDPAGIFNLQTSNDIAVARRRATANGRTEAPGRVVAELPRGFWRFLLAGRYDRPLWLSCLRQAFPRIRGRGMRRDVHANVRDLHLLRNRIAHHEPIHNRPLTQLHRQASRSPTGSARSHIPGQRADPRCPTFSTGGRDDLLDVVSATIADACARCWTTFPRTYTCIGCAGTPSYAGFWMHRS